MAFRKRPGQVLVFGPAQRDGVSLMEICVLRVVVKSK